MGIAEGNCFRALVQLGLISKEANRDFSSSDSYYH